MTKSYCLIVRVYLIISIYVDVLGYLININIVRVSINESSVK